MTTTGNSDAPTVTWVIGAGGLLGTTLVNQLSATGHVLTTRVAWTDPPAAARALGRGIDDLLATAGGGRWRIAWCAGAGVTGTSAEVFAQEIATFATFLDRLADRLSTQVTGPGSFFLASSAGGVYAGSGLAPFSETHPAQAISAYGSAKLACEQIAETFAAATGTRLLIGRIANLYGPGQNLAKPQGLVSHICRAHITGQPISVYVSLDTVRDYLFVGDCAAMIDDGLALLDQQAAGAVTMKILASGQGVTIGALLGECRRIFKRAPRVVLGTSVNAKYQVRDLRLRSVVWTELDRRSLTPLPVGISSTVADMRRRMQLGGSHWNRS